MEMDDDTWYALRNTPGVTGFVNINNVPVPLPDSEVQSIIKGMTAEAPRVKISFQVGDTVRITDGPFADFRGEIDEISQEKGKIRVSSRSSDGRHRSSSIFYRPSGKPRDIATPS